MMKHLGALLISFLLISSAHAQIPNTMIPYGFQFNASLNTDTLAVSPTTANTVLGAPGPLLLVINQSRTGVCLNLGADSSVTATWPCNSQAVNYVAAGQQTILVVPESYGATPYLAGITAPGSTGGTLSLYEGTLSPLAGNHHTPPSLTADDGVTLLTADDGVTVLLAR
jgi:hypothetical protein